MVHIAHSNDSSISGRHAPNMPTNAFQSVIIKCSEYLYRTRRLFIKLFVTSYGAYCGQCVNIISLLSKVFYIKHLIEKFNLSVVRRARHGWCRMFNHPLLLLMVFGVFVGMVQMRFASMVVVCMFWSFDILFQLKLMYQILLVSCWWIWKM